MLASQIRHIALTDGGAVWRTWHGMAQILFPYFATSAWVTSMVNFSRASHRLAGSHGAASRDVRYSSLLPPVLRRVGASSFSSPGHGLGGRSGSVSLD